MGENGRQDFKCKNCGKPVRELRLKSYCCDKCRTIRHREMRKEYMRTYQREYQRRYRALHKPITAIIRHPTSAPLAH